MLDGKDPFDELTMVDDHGETAIEEPAGADPDKDRKPVGV